MMYNQKYSRCAEMVDHGIDVGVNDVCGSRMHFIAEKLLGRKLEGRALTPEVRADLVALGESTVDIFNKYKHILESEEVVRHWRIFEGDSSSNFPKWSNYKPEEN